MRVRTWGAGDSPQSGQYPVLRVYHVYPAIIFTEHIDKSREQCARHVTLLKVLQTGTKTIQIALGQKELVILT